MVAVSTFSFGTPKVFQNSCKIVEKVKLHRKRTKTRLDEDKECKFELNREL